MKVLKHQKKNLFNQLNFDTTMSFRNFLFRIINSDISTFEPLSEGENMLMVYDIIMYIQFVDQERLMTLPEDSEEDDEEQTDLRDEINSAQEKLSDLFYDKDTSRIDIFENLMTRETSLIKHKFGVEFITQFFDFFDYYIPSEESQAIYANIHLVFENFYHFINKLRFVMSSEEENSYMYVLDNLEMCLRFTDHYDAESASNPISQVCDFSHRKYAEMYFFYKFYLLRT